MNPHDDIVAQAALDVLAGGEVDPQPFLAQQRELEGRLKGLVQVVGFRLSARTLRGIDNFARRQAPDHRNVMFRPAPPQWPSQGSIFADWDDDDHPRNGRFIQRDVIRLYRPAIGQLPAELWEKPVVLDPEVPDGRCDLVVRWMAS